MLLTRIIPTLLYDGTSLVKGRGFDHSRRVGHLMQAVRVHMARDVDELVLLFVDAPFDIAVVERVADECRVPLAVGGGVCSVEDARRLLAAGADKVVLGAANPVLSPAADRLGSSTVTASLAYEHPARAARDAVRLQQAGAGEVLLQCVSRDGTMTGYDTTTLADVAQSVSVPVVASGGAGCPAHMLDALRAGADAVAAGAMWQFSEHTPRAAKRYLSEHGVAVRMEAVRGPDTR